MKVEAGLLTSPEDGRKTRDNRRRSSRRKTDTGRGGVKMCPCLSPILQGVNWSGEWRKKKLKRTKEALSDFKLLGKQESLWKKEKLRKCNPWNGRWFLCMGEETGGAREWAMISLLLVVVFNSLKFMFPSLVNKLKSFQYWLLLLGMTYLNQYLWCICWWRLKQLP